MSERSLAEGPEVAADGEPARASTPAGSDGPTAAAVLGLQRSAGNRAVGAMLAAGASGQLPPAGARSVARAVRSLQRDPKIGPAATIPENSGDIERGYFSITDKDTFGVRVGGPGGTEKGLFVDHLFETQSEAEAYARYLGAHGADQIRQDTALPVQWPPKPDGTPNPGNPVMNVYVVKIPAGTPNIQGVVKPQPESDPSLPGKAYAGGGPQTVLSWAKKPDFAVVSQFPVGAPATSAPVTPPKPAAIAAPAPLGGFPAPAASIGLPSDFTAKNPMTVGRMYAPTIQDDYYKAWRAYHAEAGKLADMEDEEKNIKALGIAVPDSDTQAKAAVADRVKAAQAAMIQATKDLELLNSPAAKPKDIQEMFARRGIAAAIPAQQDQSGAAVLKDSGISAWGLSDKGFSKKSSTSTTETTVEGLKPKTTTTESYTGTTIGFGTAKVTTDGTKTTVVAPGGSKETDKSTVWGGDILKGEATRTKSDVTTTTDDKGKVTKVVDNTVTTAGISGYTRTKIDSTQEGDKLTEKTKSDGLALGGGKAGYAFGRSSRSGTLTGPPGEEKLDKGKETNIKGQAGIVDDDKGAGIGASGTGERKQALGDGKSVGVTVGGGGRMQTLVAQVPGSDPPVFTIMTTITFDASLALGGGKDVAAAGGAMKDPGVKGAATAGVNVGTSRYASFKRVMTDAEAKTYVDYVKANGAGSTLPEHKLLYTGMTTGWGEAWKAWKLMQGSPELLKSMKPGESLETNADNTAGADIGGTGGESGTGGFGAGASYGVKGRSKVNKTSVIRADGKLQMTVLIYDETEQNVGGSVSSGFASGKAGHSWTKGSGRTIVFVIDPKDPAYDAVVTEIRAATEVADIDLIAHKYPKMLGSSTSTDVTGEGDSVGAALGPASIDLAGKAKLTKEVTTGPDGRITGTKSTGESTTGGTVGVGPIKVGDSKTESVTGETVVDDDGTQHALGKSTKQTTATSWSKTWAAIKAAPKDPLKTITDPGSLVKSDTTTDSTLYYQQGDYDHIVMLAHNENGWMSKVASPSKRPDWAKCMYAIRAASHWVETEQGGRWAYDATKVQDALAAWTASSGGSRADAVDAVVRPGSEGGGISGTLPASLAALEDDFKHYAVRDPVAESKTLKAFDKVATADNADPAAFDAALQPAMGEMNEVLGHLKALSDAFTAASSQFGDPNQGREMIGAINKRMTAVNNEIAYMRDQKAHNLGTAAQATAAKATESKSDADKAAAEKLEQEAAAAQAAAKADEAKQQEDQAHKNFDQMWRCAATINSMSSKARALYADDLTANVDAINKSLFSARNALNQWRSLRAQNRTIISTYGGDAWNWLMGPPDPDAPDGGNQSVADAFSATWKACGRTD